MAVKEVKECRQRLGNEVRSAGEVRTRAVFSCLFSASGGGYFGGAIVAEITAAVLSSILPFPGSQRISSVLALAHF